MSARDAVESRPSQPHPAPVAMSHACQDELTLDHEPLDSLLPYFGPEDEEW